MNLTVLLPLISFNITILHGLLQLIPSLTKVLKHKFLAKRQSSISFWLVLRGLLSHNLTIFKCFSISSLVIDGHIDIVRISSQRLPNIRSSSIVICIRSFSTIPIGWLKTDWDTNSTIAAIIP
ncbi:hypothetical protein C2G38_2100965 [Gigaspora rosea]|uniref:Uncharacterized protein n=1 Tax=Gigaspora rosea TaxID=44941 RepID=A0A397USX0_9GLOM|nr:hypothetical protein C2G38_2100965 [Gigaspora rosea]